MAHSRMMRNFIILQEDEKDQSISKDKVLSGYVKVETKLDRCKISFYAQNIKADENKCYMALICYKKETKQIVNIGTLPIGKEGKCDTNIEFPINDIAGLGFSAEKIIGAAICKEIQGKVVYLMYGFINGHVPKEDWKKFSSVKCKEADKQEKEEVEVKVIQKEGTEVKAAKKEEKHEENKECKKEDDKNKELVPKKKENKESCNKKDDYFDEEYISGHKCKKDEKDKCDDKKKIDKDKKDKCDDYKKADKYDKDKCDDNKKIDKDKCTDKKKDEKKKEEKHHDECECKEEKHKHHDDNDQCKKCSSIEQQVPAEGVSLDLPLETPINVSNISLDKKFVDAVRCDEADVLESDDYEQLRDLKLKEVEKELEEVKEKIFTINKKNQEAIMNELKKFKDLCFSQVQAAIQIVPKTVSKITNSSDSNTVKKRDGNIFDEYEEKVDNARSLRFESNETYNIKGRVGEYFDNLLSEFDVDNNSIKDIKYCKWYNIPVKNIQQMCDKENVSKQGIVYKMMVNNYPYIIKSGHFLFGIKGDQEGNAKYLVYAVPGTSNIKDQPYGGKSGFVTWVQDAGKDKGMGYWLMFYDYKNQILVVPMKEN